MRDRGRSDSGTERGIRMDKQVCEVCGFIYDPAEGDPENGVPPGTAFEDLPGDWACPVCGVEKGEFKSER